MGKGIGVGLAAQSRQQQTATQATLTTFQRLLGSAEPGMGQGIRLAGAMGGRVSESAWEWQLRGKKRTNRPLNNPNLQEKENRRENFEEGTNLLLQRQGGLQSNAPTLPDEGWQQSRV